LIPDFPFLDVSMAKENQTMNDSGNSSLLEQSKFFREHVQTVLNLATGSFVLSVTFLHDRGSGFNGVYYLKCAWTILAASILLGLAYNYVLTVSLNINDKRLGTILSVLSLIFHATFVAAIFYLLRFGFVNV
jgi:hypothetical protein